MLGILNFFRSHIPGYAEIAKPLTDALSSKKGQTHFQLTNDARKAFEVLKQLVCQAPVLVPPKYGEPYHLYTDSSLYAVGCCLSQIDELGNEHPIAYGSHKLTPIQSNWSTIEREAFAILWALNRFHDIIFGAHVVIKCDHDPLKYLLQNTTQSPKLTLSVFGVGSPRRAGCAASGYARRVRFCSPPTPVRRAFGRRCSRSVASICTILHDRSLCPTFSAIRLTFMTTSVLANLHMRHRVKFCPNRANDFVHIAI